MSQNDLKQKLNKINALLDKQYMKMKMHKLNAYALEALDIDESFPVEIYEFSLSEANRLGDYHSRQIKDLERERLLLALGVQPEVAEA